MRVFTLAKAVVCGFAHLPKAVVYDFAHLPRAEVYDLAHLPRAAVYGLSHLPRAAVRHFVYTVARRLDDDGVPGGLECDAE